MGSRSMQPRGFVLLAAALLLGLGFWLGGEGGLSFFGEANPIDGSAVNEYPNRDERALPSSSPSAELVVKTPLGPGSAILDSTGSARSKDSLSASGSSGPSTESLETVAHTERESSSDETEDEAGDELGDWIHTRYRETQDERAKIKQNATREHRRLNVEELAQSWGLEFDMQEELGDVAYDQLLYQEGRRNRVRVHWVTRGSSALAAGIQSGDVILSYDGNGIFSPQALRERNKSLESGQTVAIEYLRDGTVYESVIEVSQVAATRAGLVNGMTLIPYSEEPE